MLRTSFVYILVIVSFISMGCGMIGVSNRDTSDPNVSLSFTEVLNDPETYIDKVLTFEAVVKRARYGRNVELYTNNNLRLFSITTHGVALYSMDENGEEVEIFPNQKYRFKCRIYEIKIDQHGIWDIQAEFIVSDEEEILHQPELVN
ncbi:hypothetical protein C6503_10670 [Candidatus Poribacteria bacterium]|nr:MAG: hypothetical protein C6503_10670 [Candidatus Poribacteria bacterium]